MNHCNELSVVAGDALAFDVEFFEDGEPLPLDGTDVTKIAMTVHYDDSEEEFANVGKDGNTASFLLTGADTMRLKMDNPLSNFEICVHIWLNGVRNTPIHRKTLTIREC